MDNYLIYIFPLLRKLGSNIIINKLTLQKNIPHIIYSFFIKPKIFIVSIIILGVIASINTTYFLGILIIIPLNMTLRTIDNVSWLQYINNYNYRWFWRNNKFELTSDVLDNNNRINILNQFLMKLNDNDWCVRLHYIYKIINNIENKYIRITLVFHYKEDMIQCKMVT